MTFSFCWNFNLYSWATICFQQMGVVPPRARRFTLTPELVSGDACFPVSFSFLPIDWHLIRPCLLSFLFCFVALLIEIPSSLHCFLTCEPVLQPFTSISCSAVPSLPVGPLDSIQFWEGFPEPWPGVGLGSLFTVVYLLECCPLAILVPKGGTVSAFSASGICLFVLIVTN